MEHQSNLLILNIFLKHFQKPKKIMNQKWQVSVLVSIPQMRQIIAKLMTVLMINRFEILMHG
ncbi:hypothetical protein halTADL_1284 [Halohasta litchfieldiae]|uniref:Uncharacterized protein n=2 Tax=Haloferacaceae TaxID=1644056 RepID=B9LWS9_HALLT|nr:hypothetical protein Hlac_3408 [Halorubrum lacusprofundi ATCC 49239]ATW88065.1 hypothetical protein halTADL_1284 [Halohasta litchfieldiae]SEJ03229.1 hypothetical protein SAMN05444271_11719 [Halohasta litchfieldiae]